MDSHAQTNYSTQSLKSAEVPENSSSFIPPAQLWIGKEDELLLRTDQYLQLMICPDQGCNTCIQCIKIRSRQHHNIIWLIPDKQYTLESLAVIGKTIAFARIADDPLFFILQKADCLRSAGAHSLLKTIEEPPIGYHFILLASCLDDVMLTIRSRCLITVHQQTSITSEYKDLFSFFADTQHYDPLAFTQCLEKSVIHEFDSRLLLDTLIQHWTHMHRIAVNQHDTSQAIISKRVIELLKKSSLHPPMSGSTKLFWKNFFLQFQLANHL